MSRGPTGEDRRELALAALPADAERLHDEAGAPPRLWAHHCLVHDVATRLVAALRARAPQLTVAADAVRFGAATHDLGKALVPEELSAPGSRHEALGRQWMLDRGVAPGRARFAVTHASWDGEVELEDLLVAAADKVWKGARVEALEARLVEAVATALEIDRWRAFALLDDLLADLADDAEARLAWQGRFAVAP